MSSADVSQNFATKHDDSTGVNSLLVALIGPDKKRRKIVAKALAETRRASVREFDSYPPEQEHLQTLLNSFDVILLDVDSNPDTALGLVERARAGDAAKIMVYSENADPKLAVRVMRAGAREYFLLPFEQGAVTEALMRIATTTTRENDFSADKTLGKLLVFTGSKGGSGVTTVACNVAIALAQRFEQRILLIDLALPIGDAALCLGISAGYSTEDALRNIERLDASLLHNLLFKHRSGVYVLAAPTKVPEIDVSKTAIDKLIAIARREFDHVIVDVGSRIDVAAKALFEDATTIYLVSQTGISELRNSNRLISQFFTDGNSNLEIVINRFGSRFLEPVNEDVVAKALGRPVRWKIPDDQDAARALQSGDMGIAETRISRISLEMGGSITGRPIPQEKKRDFDRRSPGGSNAHPDSGSDSLSGPANSPSTESRSTPTITWPTPDPIKYGDKLTFAQLDAASSVDGTFVYTPGPGYVLPVGTHSLWVTFTPADLDAYVPLQASTSITVGKATPAVSWPTPGGIIYGAALDDTQLNASALIPGKFEYSPSAGVTLPPGIHTLSVTFTPNDGTNYTSSQATVSLNVARAISAIEWPAPSPITYGTQLSTMQLCAVASVAGTLEYSPGPGAVLAAGEHKLSVIFSPTDTMAYATSQASVSLKVTKATPVITWPSPDPIAQGSALSAAQLNATANVPGTFVYSPAVGQILTPGVHQLSVTFTPTDTLNYTTVSFVVPLTVTEKTPVAITWPAPSALSYGTPLSGTQLNATASVPGTFVYFPSAGLVLAPGSYTLSASFTPSDTDKYATAHASVMLEVEGLQEPVQETAPDNGAPSAAAVEKPAPATETPAPSADKPYTWTFTAINPAPAGSNPAEARDEHTATEETPRETRVYKGAVYEKGEDGQWHLQKK